MKLLTPTYCIYFIYQYIPKLEIFCLKCVKVCGAYAQVINLRLCANYRKLLRCPWKALAAKIIGYVFIVKTNFSELFQPSGMCMQL